jgi:SAM-dependent methyltransferase
MYRVRRYRSYDEYVSHQASKLGVEGDLSVRDETFRRALSERLRGAPFASAGPSVVCLGARNGGEVRAFLDLGAFAIGIDLNPGERNPVVLTGDFHKLQFPDRCVDIVYTNSLDHALDLPRVFQEVRRVLRPDGVFIVEAGRGTEEGGVFLEWEATAWPAISELARTIVSAGFQLAHEEPITVPFRGRHLRFAVDAAWQEGRQPPAASVPSLLSPLS